MIIPLILIITWVIGSVIAYPFHKRFRIKELGETAKEWTRGDLISCYFTCLALWWGVLIWVGISKIDNFFLYNTWLNKKSKH